MTDKEKIKELLETALYNFLVIAILLCYTKVKRLRRDKFYELSKRPRII